MGCPLDWFGLVETPVTCLIDRLAWLETSPTCPLDRCGENYRSVVGVPPALSGIHRRQPHIRDFKIKRLEKIANGSWWSNVIECVTPGILWICCVCQIDLTFISTFSSVYTS